jgi:hypothetical protein
LGFTFFTSVHAQESPVQVNRVIHVISSKPTELNVVRIHFFGTSNDPIVTFDLCPSIMSADCRTIGKPTGYRWSILNRTRKALRWEALGVNALDLAMLAGGVAIGGVSAFVGSAILRGSGMMAIEKLAGVGLCISGGTFVTLTPTLMNVKKFFGPVWRWKAADAISSEKMERMRTGDLIIPGSVQKYADRLENALSRANQPN